MTEQFEQGYAVIIGIDENENKAFALPTVTSDIEALYAVVVHPERCGFKPENVKLISGTEATKTNIFNALLWLQEKAEEDGEITAVIYYAGHGWKDKETNQYNLIPYAISDTIKAEEFATKIKAIKSDRTFVALDCYDADEMSSKGVGNVPFPIDLFDDSTYVMLNTSSSFQLSYTGENSDTSAFIYQVIETLAPVYEMMMDEFSSIMFDDVDPVVLASDVVTRDTHSILMADVDPVTVDETVVQPRRLEAAMPKSVRVGDTTEVLVMIPRISDQGLQKILPKETEAGDMIADDDMSSRDVEIEFPEPEKPIFVYIKVDANDLDFDVEDPVRKIKIHPDKEGDYQAFYLIALRPVRRARVVVKLFIDEELTDSVGTVRLTVPIEPSTDDVEARLLKVREQELLALLYKSSITSVTIVNGDIVAGDKVGGDKVAGDKIDIGSISGDNSAIAVGRDANADVVA